MAPLCFSHDTKLFAASEIEKTPKRCTPVHIVLADVIRFPEISDVVIAQIEKCKKKSTNEFFKISFFFFTLVHDCKNKNFVSFSNKSEAKILGIRGKILRCYHHGKNKECGKLEFLTLRQQQLHCNYLRSNRRLS